MTPDKCPGCGVKLRPEMLACPNCPMSFPEDDGPPAGAVNPLRQSRYYQFVFPVLFFGAIGAAVWYLGTGLMRLGNDSSQRETGSFFDDSKKKNSSSRKSVRAPQQSDGTAQPSEPKAPEDEGSVTITRSGGDAVPFARDEREKPARGARPAASPRAVPAPRADQAEAFSTSAPTEWKLRGTVYDLTTLKPLAGCSIVFKDEGSNRSIKTRTDSTGSYRAIVPPLSGGSGYSVSIDRSGYAPNYLNPGTEGVREMDSGQRWGMARDLAATLAAAPATVQSESEKPLVTDFYLAPRR